MAITWTQTEYDTLKAAVASGVLTVKYSGPPAREVTYHSLADMRALLASMEQSLNAQTGVVGHSVASTKKGFDT